MNERRNLPLALLEPLRACDVEFYSLQQGEPAESEIKRCTGGGWNGPPSRDPMASISDFASTAGLVEHLDLVITVDTSTAHLAAAMGKPIWLVNRFETCWRWQLERSDRPWYPTLRI